MLLAMVGDVMLGRGVAQEIARHRPTHFWGDTLPFLRRADLFLIGLECAITTNPVKWSRTPKVFHFRAPPSAVEILKVAGVDCCELANNHILDFEEQGLLDTLDALDAAGIAHVGAGRNLNEAAAPAILEAADVRIGVIAFTDNEPVWAATSDQPGTNYIQIRSAPDTLRRVEQGVLQARAQGADIVVLALHWGPNMRQRPTARFKAFAHAVLDLGVDLIHGHSAHIFQGVEIYRGKAILYDTGDYIDDYRVDPALRNDHSLLFLADIDKRGIRELRMIPVRLDYATVTRATGADLEQITERMIALSAEMGTEVVDEEGILKIPLREAPTTPGQTNR